MLEAAGQVYDFGVDSQICFGDQHRAGRLRALRRRVAAHVDRCPNERRSTSEGQTLPHGGVLLITADVSNQLFNTSPSPNSRLTLDRSRSKIFSI